jgi:uncharacterized protein
MEKTTLVIGASENPERYSYKAINMLRANSIPVVALGLKPGQVADVAFVTGKPELNNIDTITLYIGPKNQPEWYSYLIGLQPRRIIFNPGTENSEFLEMVEKAGIETLEACTLVLLSVKDY